MDKVGSPLLKVQVFSHPRVSQVPRINFSVWGSNLFLALFALPPPQRPPTVAIVFFVVLLPRIDGSYAAYG